MRYYYQKEFLGLAAWYSKANKQDRLVERGGGRVADICPKANSPHPLHENGVRAFIDRGGRWLHAERAQSSLTVIFNLVTSGLTSIILIVLGTVNLQFQGSFVSIF